MSSTYPYIAKATVKYKSPHATDLSFAKGETIRVTGVSDEDEDWMIGESIDGERKGGFPRDFVEAVEHEDEDDAIPPPTVSAVAPMAAATAVVPAVPTPAEEHAQRQTTSEPERSGEPAAQPLPEAEAIPGSFNPELAEAEIKEDVVVAPETEAVPAPMPVPISAPAPAVSNTTTPVPPTQTPTGTAPPPAQASAGDTPEPSKLSFKDRLAAFNKPKPTAGSTGGQGPPPLKPKPAGAGGLTWSQRQKIREEEERKAKEEAGGEAVEAVRPTPATTAEAAAPSTTNEQTSAATTTSNEEKSGMSASDAKASIGLSLKERMAALSGSQAFGGTTPKQEETGEAGERKPTKTWKRPEVAEGAPLAVPGQMPMPVPVRSGSSRSIEASADNDIRDEKTGVDAGDGQTEGAEGEEEQSEEQKEKERRAAIAARMARLGGRGMFGGPPPPLAPKPGAQKKASTEVDPPTVAELDKVDTSFHTNTAEAGVVSPPAVADSQPASPTPNTAPGGGIAMPSIPKRAAGPRRRAGGAAPAASSRSNSQTASTTGADQDATPSGGQLAQDTPLASGAAAEQARRDITGDEDKAVAELAGSGSAGAEGAESAGIAMHTPPAQVQQQNEEQDQAEDLALIGGADAGQDLARRADGPVLVGAEGDADAEYRSGPSDVILGGGSTGVSRMPPPPAPPGGFESEDEQDDEDGDDVEDDLLRQAKSGQMHVEPSRIDVEEGLPRQPEEEEQIASPTSPIGFAPLHSPADEVPASPRRGSASPISPVGGTNAALASLGLPRDEVELKHEQDAIQQENDDAGEDNEDEAPPPPPRAERLADRPLGPRPMPNPPILGQTVDPELVADTAVRETDRAELGVQGDSTDEEEGDAPPPPPRRQESISEPAQVGLALPQDAAEAAQPRQAVASPPPVVSEEPNAIVPADEEATRRQNIAARMAKLGGIKLGGPPLGINTRQSSTVSDAGLTSPTAVPPTPRSPVPEEPLSPIGSVAPAATVGTTMDTSDESEEAAAVRRRATLARLQAGGHLGGFNMFSRNVEPQSPTVETTQGIANEAADVDERNLEPERIDEQDNQFDPAASRQQLLVEQEEEEVSSGDEAGGAAPPPPPRRPTQMASPPQSPIGETPMSPIRDQTSHGVAGTGALETTPSGTLPPPIPIMTSNMSAEPVMMSPRERDEDDDAMGPPPPPRPADIVTTAPAHQRSDSRASRISIGSRTSTGGGVPVSPTTPRRTSMQAGRPAYNELQQASSTFGSKVYRAAQKLAESGKRQSIGDGSSRSFVWAALGDAGIDANTSFGTLIWEQEGSTTHKRYDDARVGDVVVLHDAKLKGKKGLVPYTQQVGSVEEPMFAICAETEQKKNKVKVWQVERGHITTESYRLEDLQSGLVRVFRPMAQ